ncbi:MAG TPA: glycoside hydrolase family 97 C-terminal domain-containing protein, partial [Opitutaceae bacterium]
FARRKGDDWYVAIVNGDAAASRDVSLPLAFLGQAGYTAALHRDDPADPAAIVHEPVRPVSRAETISVTLRPGGGFVGVFRPGRSGKDR